MIREITVVSGKGGTGKTSVTAAFAKLAGRSVVCDLDVDAADLHILLHPQVLDIPRILRRPHASPRRGRVHELPGVRKLLPLRCHRVERTRHYD